VTLGNGVLNLFITQSLQIVVNILFTYKFKPQKTAVCCVVSVKLYY